MKHKPFSRKQIIRDNTDLEARLEQCYAANAELVIMAENNKIAISQSNINELIAVNEKLRAKHSRIRKRLTEVMDKFNIVYNFKTKEYEQKIN